MTDQGMELTGKLLLAMPGMGDMRFDHSVVFLCEHSAKGAMGLIVNKPAQDLALGEVLEQLDIEVTPDVRQMPVHFGGPVESSRGFVLHSGDYQSGAGTLEVDDAISMTATQDILEDIAAGNGPERSLLALGYSGWGPGQLEAEIAQNGWLTATAPADILFGRANEHKWSAALKVLGIDPLLLSAEAGNA